jgi:hypothetical protein
VRKLYIVSILDGSTGDVHDARMATRRSRFDPLKSVDQPRWLTVRDAYGALLEQRRLAPASDLKAAMVRALAEHAAAGWILEAYSSELACSFCHLGDARRQITVETTDPTQARPYGNVRGFS